MARKRVIEAPALKTWEDVNDALRQIAEAQIALGDIESDMIAKLREGKKTCKEIQQEVNSWLGFARWASAYNLATKIFAPYRFIKVEGELPYGAISRPRQARRILQQRYDTEKAHKALAS